MRLRVNGREHTRSVPPRLLLSDFLRHHLGLTGTHVGCEHGVCGACTVLLDGEAVRSCLLLAVQAAGSEVTTVEGLAEADGPLHPVQQAFHEMHALQCGFCTPGFLLSVVAFLRDVPAPSDDEIRHGLAGNLCRCTGYQNIVRAVRRASELLAARRPPPDCDGPLRLKREPSAKENQAMATEVVKVELKNVQDASGLEAAILAGRFTADQVVAVVGKTEGNGGVNDFTRILADQAFRRVLAAARAPQRRGDRAGPHGVVGRLRRHPHPARHRVRAKRAAGPGRPVRGSSSAPP